MRAVWKGTGANVETGGKQKPKKDLPPVPLPVLLGNTSPTSISLKRRLTETAEVCVPGKTKMWASAQLGVTRGITSKCASWATAPHFCC